VKTETTVNFIILFITMLSTAAAIVLLRELWRE